MDPEKPSFVPADERKHEFQVLHPGVYIITSGVTFFPTPASLVVTFFPSNPILEQPENMS